MMVTVNIEFGTERHHILNVLRTPIDQRPLIPVVRMSVDIALNKILMDFRTDHLLQKT